MKTHLIVLVCLIGSVFSINLDGKKVEGSIKYPADLSDDLPAGSCLIAVIADTSKQDVAAKSLAHEIYRNPSKANLKYSIPFPNKDIPRGVSIDMVLNVGHCSNSGDFQVNNGDYVTRELNTIDDNEMKNPEGDVVKGPTITLMKHGKMMLGCLFCFFLHF